MTFNGVTNAGNFNQHRVTVSTTPDADVVNSPFFTIVPTGQLARSRSPTPRPRRGGSAHELRAGVQDVRPPRHVRAGRRLRRDLPPTRATTAGPVASPRRHSRCDVGTWSNPVNAAVQCSLFTDRSSTRVTCCGSRSPGSPTRPNRAPDKLVRVATTSDWALLPSAPFTVVAAQAMGAVTVLNARRPTPPARARATSRLRRLRHRRAVAGRQQPPRRDLPDRNDFAGWAGATIDPAASTSATARTRSPSRSSARSSPVARSRPARTVTLTFDGITNGAGGRRQDAHDHDDVRHRRRSTSAPFTVVPAGA